MIDLPGLEFLYIASELASAVADHTSKVDSNQAIGNVLGIGTREVESAEDVWGQGAEVVGKDTNGVGRNGVQAWHRGPYL